MRDVVTDIAHLFFTLPFYAVLGLAAAAVLAWRRGRGSRLYRWRHALTLGAVLVFLASLPVIPNAIVLHVERQFDLPDEQELARLAARGDAQIVVLSGGWFRRVDAGYEVQMGSNSWEHSWAAVALWRRIGGTLIFSGAPLPDGSDSVAQHMAEAALQWGVPKERVMVETKSRNTFENLSFTHQQFRLGSDARPLVLVTSALHLPRAVAIARHLGLAVIPYPCNFRAERRLHWRMWLPGNDGLANIEGALHEWFGLLTYRLRGWA